MGVSAIPVPPPIEGARRTWVDARGVRFHVTEAGPQDGFPVLCLHGWPQHHMTWRGLLADPPAGLRIIAPDLPGYGWSGPAPHRWAKEDVASDVLALMDAIELRGPIGLVGHDWGGWVGHLLCLRAPERFTAYLAVNIAHVWNGPREVLPHLWRFAQYQPLVAAFGVPLHRRTTALHLLFRMALADRSAMSSDDIALFADRFRDPVCARAATDTYRTFVLRELPRLSRAPETRRSTVPTRALFGTGDVAIHPSLADPATANAADYTLERVEGCGHFLPDERPDALAAKVRALFAA